MTESISPFFIVNDAGRTIAFYPRQARLRDPVPAAGTRPFLCHPLQDTHDGLRGFEITDPDGYRLFFGRPR